MKIKFFTAIILGCIIVSCNDGKKTKAVTSVEVKEKAKALVYDNKGQQLVYDMVQKVGNYKSLRAKKDVVYTYTYQTPDGKTDVSTEKYLFNGELSYGAYKRHERTLPNLEGLIEQGFDGSTYWLKHNGVALHDEKYLKRVAFNRPTNFYWFTMMQKLLDPGVNYEYLKEETIDGTGYDVVKISFTSDDDKPSDIYQLYVNKKTGLVDQFLFTVADFGVMDTPNLMKLQYEEVDGMVLPTKRLYKKSTWDADVSDAPWIKVTWSDIKFNNGLTQEDFE
ncbi:DUF6503 family protein [Maribacter sp. TH_r10]|uniref:DUF6503 family protein n=1 Tax=Maribacter sp. TH_r10 TaxID=3082086 RepID=UPI002953C5E7|nr:DUF6503 family protein [Maribacter sp. TH_r10]MDV7139484.1 DUF6503 family protein [Maribacter sp. TH_r10]